MTTSTPIKRKIKISKIFFWIFPENPCLVSAALFDKYVDFIDLYAEVTPEEKQTLYQEIIQNEQTAMPAQYIRKNGFFD